MNCENKRKKLNDKIFCNELNKVMLWWIFAVYFILLVWVIGFKYNSEWLPEVGMDMRSLPLKSRMVLVPFQKFKTSGSFFVADYFFNTLIYIPLGLILPLTMRKIRGGYICCSRFLFANI